MKIICVIPARYESSRFPGKPLADINGKPMIWWVYQQCKKVNHFDEIYVATDDVRIQQICETNDMNVIMTSKDNKTGTDRVAEVTSKIESDIVVNVQGDEPLIEPETINAVIEPMLSDKNLQISSLMTKITNPADVVNPTICKAVTNEKGYCIYLSRSPIPYPKGNIESDYFKALGIFAFRPQALIFFKNYGEKYGKSKIEKIEDIELLRFIENGYPVKFSTVTSESIAIDTPNDLKILLKHMEKKQMPGGI